MDGKVVLRTDLPLSIYLEREPNLHVPAAVRRALATGQIPDDIPFEDQRRIAEQCFGLSEHIPK